MLTFNDYLIHLRDKEIFPRFKCEFLFPDESVRFEITEDILDDSGSLSINYTQGCRRSCNLTLYNFHKQYIPSENSPLWVNNKFKLYLGMNINGEDYWQSAGVFVLQNPEVLNNFSEKKVTISGLDKFSLLDGQLNGQLDAIYQLDVGEKIEDAIKTILAFDNGNGQSIDPLLPILDSQFKDSTLFYTVRKEPGATLGEILIELANSIACDIYYDSDGRLRLESGITDLSSINRPSLYTYTTEEAEYLGSSISYQFDKIFTVCKVIGDNVSGDIATGVAENTNPFSSTRISLIGRKTKVIIDENISTDSQAQERADYELKKISILQSLVKLQSTFMIHLDVNYAIEITDDYYGFENERFLIQTLNIPLSTNSKISIDASNIRELPYYPN